MDFLKLCGNGAFKYTSANQYKCSSVKFKPKFKIVAETSSGYIMPLNYLP